VLNPEGKKRWISLAECIALSLENGRTGDFYDPPGAPSGVRAALRGLSPTGASDAIRVFAYDPAEAATEIEQGLARFDAFVSTTMQWSKIDEPQNIQAQVFARGSGGFLIRDQATFQTQLVKPLPTGGLAGITFRVDYDKSNLNERAGLLNPSYRPTLTFNFEQPLLQGAGIFINQIRNALPTGLNLPSAPGNRPNAPQGILLSRIFTDETQLEFDRRLNDMLFSVEQSYWQLYSAYWDLYSRETAMRQAHAAWQIARVRYENGRITVQEFKQVEEQFHAFRAQRLNALGRGSGRPGVLEAERKLRYMVGLPAEDGCRLIPSDSPTVAPFKPDYCVALQEALARRPDMQQIRQEVQAAYLTVLREQDLLLPDLRFFSSYNVNSVGNTVTGSGENNALRALGNNRFHDATVGLRLDYSIGYRAEFASVRRAQLGLAQRIAFLQDQEKKLASSIIKSYRDLFELHETIRIQRARREAAAEQLSARYKEFLAGRGSIDILLESQRTWADALQAEQDAIADYNISLADFERQKGTIQRHDHIAVTEGPLPKCAQDRASEHLAAQARALSLADVKKAAEGGEHRPQMVDTEAGPLPVAVPAPAAGARPVSVPALLEQQRGVPTVPDVPEKLPYPKAPAGPVGALPVGRPGVQQ
jgi:outer membrane protein TolC